MSTELPIDLKFSVKKDWTHGGGFTGDIKLTNNGKDSKGWTVEFDAPFRIKKIWNAKIVSHKGNHYVVKNVHYNENFSSNKTIHFGFNAYVDNRKITKPVNYVFNKQPLDSSPNNSYDDSPVTDSNNTTTSKTTNSSNNQFIGEIGTITDLTHLNKKIQLKNQYVNPVVFALPASNNEADPVIARITDINSDNFSLYLQEPEYEDGSHKKERLTYMVVEAGTWKLNDGTVLQVGTVDTNTTTSSGWKTVNFNDSFSKKPVVFSQVQTDNDDTFVRTRQNQAKASSFQLALEEEEKLKQSGHGKESVGWLAIETGKGTWNGMKYQAGITGDQVTHKWHEIDFSNFNKAPNLLAGLGSYDSKDSAGLRYRNLDDDQVEIRVEEDTSLDKERSHNSEIVNFLAIEGSGNLTGTAYQSNSSPTPSPSPSSTLSPSPTLSSKAISVGFEQHKNGAKYNKAAQNKDWDVDWSQSSWMDKYASISDREDHSEIDDDDDDDGNSRGKALKITYRPNVRTGGSAAWELPAQKEYYLSYWVKFENNFAFNGSQHGGGKLPGLGGAGGLCSGGDTCNGNNGFTSRYMWGEDGRAKLYLYHMNKPTKWGHDLWFEDSDGEDVYFERGKWHNLVQRVKINDGKKHNGEVDVWKDGEQVLSVDGLKFVTNNKGIDTLMFSTFHGGSGDGWLPNREVHSYFDDFVISTNASDVGL